MSIATEITRLQGIKTDIRNALVTQGISQAISHNMTDFSADILAIEGGGGEGVYITVVCDSAYQGYDIILSANELEIDRKQCPSSLEVNFFVSSEDVNVLPFTFTIGNSLNGNTVTETVSIYGWYELELQNIIKIFESGTGLAYGSYTLYKSGDPDNYGSVTNEKIMLYAESASYTTMYSDTPINLKGKYEITMEISSGGANYEFAVGLEKGKGTTGSAFTVSTTGSGTKKVIAELDGDYVWKAFLKHTMSSGSCSLSITNISLIPV